VKIKEIKAVRIEAPRRPARTPARRKSWQETFVQATPMSKYPEKRAYGPTGWGQVAVKVTAEDGTWGLGTTVHSRPVAAIVEDHFAPLLVGEDCMAIEKCWDMMSLSTKAYGTTGLTSYAISAVDLALWDLKGKLLGQPVYSLLGGPVRERTFCYATGNDTDWQLELGFKAVKLARPFGPVHGEAGLAGTVELVERTRKLIGDEVDLMLDCWQAYDVDYTVRLAERLRPYRLKWMEEYLVPEDLDGYAAVRERLPWMTLASGEHHYGPWPFFQMAARRCLDIFQADIHWVGGLTACVRIAHIAAGAGLSLILHAGGNDQYGLHFTCATPNVPWAEFYLGTPPGVPLEEHLGPIHRAVPRESYIAPAPGPGFGLAVEEEWLTPYF